MRSFVVIMVSVMTSFVIRVPLGMFDATEEVKFLIRRAGTALERNTLYRAILLTLTYLGK